MNRISLMLLLALCASCDAQTVSGPKSIQLTVYNQNFALIKDVRSVNLAKGITSIEVEDVAAKIDPTSVLFKSITAPNSVVILEQNYQYDLISPENILNKSVGERLTFTRFDDQGRPVTQSGVLLNPPKNSLPPCRPLGLSYAALKTLLGINISTLLVQPVTVLCLIFI